MTPQQATPRFHYAFAISGIERAREFYVRRLGCAEGRSTNHWIDFELFGHQLSTFIKRMSSANDGPDSATRQTLGISPPFAPFAH